MTNISERATQYAENKANEAMTKAVAQAYSDGFRDGYKDCEEEYKMNRIKFVDLGLPSGTLWAADYEKSADGEVLYLPYEQAKEMKLPTDEQWREIKECCTWDCVIINEKVINICVGPNKNFIAFGNTGYINEHSEMTSRDWARVWSSDLSNDGYGHVSRHSYNIRNGGMVKHGHSTTYEYKIPVRLVQCKQW